MNHNTAQAMKQLCLLTYSKVVNAADRNLLRHFDWELYFGKKKDCKYHQRKKLVITSACRYNTTIGSWIWNAKWDSDFGKGDLREHIMLNHVAKFCLSVCLSSPDIGSKAMSIRGHRAHDLCTWNLTCNWHSLASRLPMCLLQLVFIDLPTKQNDGVIVLQWVEKTKTTMENDDRFSGDGS